MRLYSRYSKATIKRDTFTQVMSRILRPKYILCSPIENVKNNKVKLIVLYK